MLDQQDDFPVMQVCVVCVWTSNSHIDSKAPKLNLTYVNGAKTFGKLVFLNGKQVAASLEQCTDILGFQAGRTAGPPSINIFPCIAAAAKIVVRKDPSFHVLQQHNYDFHTNLFRY
jgi:hypothetical protein